ncbi:hypothetical protein [Burkholderia pseudomallei]|uniref:hypothetical protein n=1 Tax=Burkholderia pseudomallei TaxID=28450 RepID=UPI000977E3AF|nr:hypothetical protein [Burkholderia pseudomallei]
MIPVTRKEFEKGGARARAVYTSIAPGAQTNNAHRLLLFYAVENGLKALIMRMERTRDGAADFSSEQHNLNRLLDRAGAGRKLRIVNNVVIRDHVANVPRNCSVGEINQMWRYGCVADKPSDVDIETGLKSVAQWIEEQFATQ